MTTIITKNGSGAPTAGQLSQGELAVDLTNKELYTKDSGGNVIKVGAQGGSTGTFTDLTATSSFTSPGIDDNATSTAIKIDANDNVWIGSTPAGTSRQLVVQGDADTRVDIRCSADTNLGAIDFSDSSNTARGQFVYDHNDDSMRFMTSSTEAMHIDSSGNVGIGTDAPSSVLHLSTSNDPQITLTDTGFGASADITGSNGNLRLNSQTATIFDLADSEVMRIASSGNVGIGTAAPRGPLHVEDGDSGCPDTSGSANDLILEGSGNTGITVQTPNTGKASLFFQDPQSVSAGYVQYDHPTDSLRIGSAGAERMRITSTGDVGIGTDSPNRLLELSGSVPALRLTDTDVSSYDEILHLADGGFSLRADNGNTEANTYMGFSTDGSERMRIDSAGNLLVGKTASAVAQPGVEIRDTADVFSSVPNSQNTYHVYDTTAQGFTFYVSATGTINAANTTIASLSDERLKENVRDLDDGLSKVMALQPRKFDWKAGKGRDISDDRGFIAQEFETVFPDMVNNDGLNLDENGESYKTIGANLVPTLVKAIQEQQAMIETLQAEVAALKGA